MMPDPRMVRIYEERARQEAYRNSPEQKARRAARIANGLCVLEDGQCVTHGVPDTMRHHFEVHPDAYND